MAITKVSSGWRVDVQPGGRKGSRIRKTFKTKADALQFERKLLAGLPNKVENSAISQSITLSEFIDKWYSLHGINLKSARDTLNRLKSLTQALGNPSVFNLKALDFAEYRKDRLASGVSPATLNRERSYLVGVFSEMARLGHWSQPNPIKSIRPFKVDQSELTFLSLCQVRSLLSQVSLSSNVDLALVVDLCLATGCRWSEAEGLKFSGVSLSSVTFTKTKGGRSRTVPISIELATRLMDRLSLGRFASCYGAFRSALARTGLQLPKGQAAHVLRHTFASLYLQNGGTLQGLQKVLGHSSITVTMIYAHLSSDHLQEVLRLNPLALLSESVDTSLS